ncbi:MAG: trypsin-like peptidase domain-containing protein [Pseudomonadota bacterium]
MRSAAYIPVLLLLPALAACGGEDRGDGDARRVVRVRPAEDVAASPPLRPSDTSLPDAPDVADATENPPPAGGDAPEPGTGGSGDRGGDATANADIGPPLQLPAPPAPPVASPGDVLPDFAALYASAAPSVVALEVHTDPSERQGTGFFIDPLGRVLTSAHVIEGATKIFAVTQTGRRLEARVLGADPHTDLALLVVEGEDLPAPLPLAVRDIRVGEWVMAIGTPLGLAFSATRGIVSATGRSDVVWDPAGYTDFIQTDAAINRGNSGGPLLGIDGVVLGVCAAIDPEANRIGFAVPASMARVVATHLQANGRLVRSFLGVQLTEDPEGIRVVSVLPDSPAAEAGLRVGDRIRTWGGEPAGELNPFRWRVATTPPRTVTALEIERGMLRLDLSVRTEEAPDRTGR